MPKSPEIRPLTPTDTGAAAHVLAQAFIEDPMCVTMLPVRRTRAATLAKVFGVMGGLSIRSGRGYGVGDPLQGVAYWKSPTEKSLSLRVSDLGRLLPLVFTFYPVGLLRVRSVLKTIDALHDQHASQPHYYLDNLGVLPAARGQGLSSRLVRPFLDKADAEGVCAYTDTVTPANVGLYEHFGFTVMDAIHVGGTGITVWSLLRSPQSRP
jgi:ribosomal protein S18 acetylase RimI-like enzyme